MSEYRLNLVTAPASEPVTLADVKTYLRIGTNETSSSEDTYITDTLIPAARQIVERYLGRALFTQTWDLIMSSQPEKIEIPLGQLQSITSIKTIDDDETENTESTSIYTVEAGDFGKVFLRIGQTWTVTTRQYDFFKIRFVAGWAAVASIPETIINGILRLIGLMWEKKESWVSQNEMAPYISDLLYPYKIWRI